MAFRSTRVVGIVAITSIATSTVATMMGHSLSELENRTTTAAGVHSNIEGNPELYSYCGADLVGGDLWEALYPNPDLCVKNCLPETGCNAATWTRFDGGTCYFKRLTGGSGWVPNRHIGVVPHAGAVSFMRREDISPYWQLNDEVDVDMPGNDLANFDDATGASCFSACLAFDKCSAYTWSSKNGGTCLLKTKASPFVPSPGARSHIINRPGYPGFCSAFL